jgi:hypothetical protein
LVEIDKIKKDLEKTGFKIIYINNFLKIFKKNRIYIYDIITNFHKNINTIKKWIINNNYKKNREDIFKVKINFFENKKYFKKKKLFK